MCVSGMENSQAPDRFIGTNASCSLEKRGVIKRPVGVTKFPTAWCQENMGDTEKSWRVTLEKMRKRQYQPLSVCYIVGTT